MMAPATQCVISDLRKVGVCSAGKARTFVTHDDNSLVNSPVALRYRGRFVMSAQARNGPCTPTVRPL